LQINLPLHKELRAIQLGKIRAHNINLFTVQSVNSRTWSH